MRRPVYQETVSDKYFATTLARGLMILRCFTPEQPVLGNKELAERTGLTRAAVSRFIHTLTRLGYLRQLAAQGKYRVGSAVLSLGYPLLAAMPLRLLARRHMSRLAEEVDGVVAMGIRDRLNIVYVEVSRSNSTFAHQFADIGFAHPIAATSIGCAYLAVCGGETRRAIMNEIRVKTPEDWTLYGSFIERNLQTYAERGYCTSSSRYRPDIAGVAVPFRRMAEGEIVIFNCLVHAHRFSRSQVETQVGPQLVSLVRALEMQ